MNWSLRKKKESIFFSVAHADLLNVDLKLLEEQSDLKNWTGRILKSIKVFGNALRIWQKYTCRRVVFFRNFTGCNNVSEASSHFKKMTYSLRQDLHSYSAICIFCVTRYIGFDKQSLGSVLKVF